MMKRRLSRARILLIVHGHSMRFHFKNNVVVIIITLFDRNTRLLATETSFSNRLLCRHELPMAKCRIICR